MRSFLVRLVNRVPLARRLTKALASFLDPMLVGEMRGDRYFFQRLNERGFLQGLADKRILEIGPKHGEDSRLLASLRPAELVLLDLPSKAGIADAWLPGVAAAVPTKYVQSNLLYHQPDELSALGRFDLVWCTGVLYHNAEQIRLCRKLYDLTADDGRLVLETQLPKDRHIRSANAIEVHWPGGLDGIPTVIFLPSTKATISMLELVGFVDVQEQPIISRSRRRSRVVITARRGPASRPYRFHAYEGNAVYEVGLAT